MSTTLVAVFNQHSDARDASRKLQSAGIEMQSIRLNGGDSGVDQVQTRTDNDEEPGAISRFFSDLFGSNDDKSDATRYTDAANRRSFVLTVSVMDEGRVEEISDLLDECGAIDADGRAQHDAQSGAMPVRRQALAATGATDATNDDTLKVVEEKLEVGTQTVQKGNVRVHRRMIETPVEEQVTLRDERATIDRAKVDRPATAAEMQNAFQNKDIVVQETTQEAVVAKSARVVEEIKIGKTASDRTETVRETLRRTEVDVNKDEAQSRPGAMAGMMSSENTA